MRNVFGIMAFILLAGQAQSAGLAKSGFIERVMTVKNTGASSVETSKLYWEGNNLRLPTLLKSQETSGALSRSVETKQLKLNYNVPDTMFSLPKGVTVKEEKFPTPPAGSKK